VLPGDNPALLQQIHLGLDIKLFIEDLFHIICGNLNILQSSKTKEVPFEMIFDLGETMNTSNIHLFPS
jgi:hypothetical protein